MSGDLWQMARNGTTLLPGEARKLALAYDKMQNMLAVVEAERNALLQEKREQDQQWEETMNRIMPDDVDQIRRQEEWEIIRSFGLNHDDGTSIAEHAMAREIRNLRNILAALRGPSETVLKAALQADDFLAYGAATRGVLAAAIAAAEQEVGNA